MIAGHWTDKRRRTEAHFHRGTLHRASVATTPPERAAETTPREVALLPADLLGGDESIILALKPSLWFVAFDSAPWVAAGLLVSACAAWIAELVPSLAEAQLLTFVVTVVGARIVVAILRWVSRSYVLTNRRVMRIRGVIKPDVAASPLVNIRNTAVTVSFPEALTKLGTLQFTLTDCDGPGAAWRNITNPHDIHMEVRKAIERSLDCQPRL